MEKIWLLVLRLDGTDFDTALLQFDAMETDTKQTTPKWQKSDPTLFSVLS